MTKDEALKKILEQSKAGLLGALHPEVGCVYRQGQKHCAIGCLLTEQQLDEIEQDGNDGFSALELYKYSFARELGLTDRQMSAVQNWHDHAYQALPREVTKQDFEDVLEGLISGEITVIADTPAFHYDYRVRF